MFKMSLLLLNMAENTAERLNIEVPYYEKFTCQCFLSLACL